MADSKLTALTALTSASSDDILYIVDDPAVTAVSKKIAISDLKTSLGLTGTNSGDQNLFSTISVSGQSDVVADSTSDTLTLVAGTNVTITTNAGTDTITIASTGGGTTMTMGYKTADQSTTSATGIDITSMSFAIAANEVWAVEFHMGITVSAAAGAKFAVTVPTSATMGGYVRGSSASPSVITASGTLTGAIVTATPSACDICVLIQNSTNAGNVVAQMASADGIVSVTAKGGQCYFIARKLA